MPDTSKEGKDYILTQEARFIRAVASTVPGIIEITNHPSGDVIFNNRDTLEMLGFEAEEIIAMGHEARKKLIHADDVHNLINYYIRFDNLTDDEENRVEYRIRNKSGKLTWLDLRGRVFQRDGTGRVTQTLHITQDITHQKKVQEELAESRELLETVLNNTASSIMLMKPVRDNEGAIVDFQYLFTNIQTLQSVGKDALAGRYFTQEFPLVKDSDLLRSYIHVMETGESYQGEVDIAPLGLPLWSQVYARKTDDHLLVIYFDITERKKAEEEIRNQARFIEQIADVVPDIITVIELPSGSMLYCNSKNLMQYGFSREEMMLMAPEERSELIYPEDLPALNNYYASFNHQTTDDEIHTIKFRARTRKNELLTFVLRGRIFKRNEDGSVRAVLNIVQNITEKEKATQELLRLKEKVARQTEDKYRVLFNSMDEGYCIIRMLYDDHGKRVDLRFLEVNPAFEKHSGLVNAAGKTAREIVPHVEKKWMDIFGAVSETGESIRVEEHSDALHRTFDLYAFRIGHPDEPLVAVLFTDITERKKSEARKAFLLKLNEALRPLSNANEIQRTATWIVGEHLQADRAFYAEFEPGGTEYYIAENYVSPGFPKRTGWFPTNVIPGMIWWLSGGDIAVIRNVRETLILSDSEKEASIAAHILAVAGVPLIKDGKLVALFCVQQGIPREWTSEDVVILQETAERTWAAVERAKAKSALRINEARMRKQKEAFQSAINGDPLEQSLNIVSSMVINETTGDARTAFYIADADGACLHPVFGAGNMPESYLMEIDGFAIGPDSFACGLAVPTGEPVLTADILKEPLWTNWTHIAGKHDYRACWSFPIKTRENRAVGTFAMYFNSPREATLKDLALADIVTQTAAVIISSYNHTRERIRAEEALRKSDDLLASVFKLSPVGIGFAEGNGNYILLNDEMKRFLPTGRVPAMDDATFPRWTAYYPDGTPVDRKDYPSVSALRGEPITPFMEMQYVADDGRKIWTRVASIPLRNEKSEVVGAVSVITDIDALKKTTEALQENERQLKQLLNQRDEFIGIASHELKTPVTSMKAYAEMVLRGLESTGNTRSVELLTRLNRQIDRLTTLINHLLDTTRISEGKLNLTLEKFDIMELLRDRVGEISPTTDHRFELTVAGLPMVTADRERIGQVITNLLSNAIKYSPKGTTITITGRNVMDSVEISVTDEGYGISEANQKRIFERFFRVTSASMNNFPGMGLGLYITAQIIHRHGGTISVQSREGKGSVFSFIVPCSQPRSVI